MPFSSYYASLWKVIGSERRIFVVFIDLKRAYEKIPRTVIWWAIEKHKVPRKYITSSSVWAGDSETDTFPITIGLHQGSSLSPYHFALVMDEVTHDIQGDILGTCSLLMM